MIDYEHPCRLSTYEQTGNGKSYDQAVKLAIQLAAGKHALLACATKEEAMLCAYVSRAYYFRQAYSQ